MAAWQPCMCGLPTFLLYTHTRNPGTAYQSTYKRYPTIGFRCRNPGARYSYTPSAGGRLVTSSKVFVHIVYSYLTYYSSSILRSTAVLVDLALDRYELMTPKKVLRIPNTDLAPFALREFCKSMQTHGNGPHEPEKYVLVYRISEVRRSGVRSAAVCCIKSVKSVFRARAQRAGAMRGGL
jgi:hypothetical protein